MSAEQTAGLLQQIVDAGTTEVVEMTPDQIAEFSAAMRPVHEQFADKIGRELLEATYAEIEKQSATLN
jgi:C4-dicarboxylate-binding protein DctP